MSLTSKSANELPLDSAKCPLCGGPNRCALVDNPNANGCWCEPGEFPPELLDQIPEKALHRVCICQNCLRSHQESANKSEGPPL